MYGTANFGVMVRQKIGYRKQGLANNSLASAGGKLLSRYHPPLCLHFWGRVLDAEVERVDAV